MYRFALESLCRWKGNKYCKPLVIEGVCQVGKVDFLKLYPLFLKSSLWRRGMRILRSYCPGVIL